MVKDPAWNTPCLMWSLALHDISDTQAPMQIDDWSSHREHVFLNGWGPRAECKYRLCLPRGWACVRDVRLYHGGTENRSQKDRHMTGIVCVSVENQYHQQAWTPPKTLPQPQYDSLIQHEAMGYLDGLRLHQVTQWDD